MFRFGKIGSDFKRFFYDEPQTVKRDKSRDADIPAGRPKRTQILIFSGNPISLERSDCFFKIHSFFILKSASANPILKNVTGLLPHDCSPAGFIKSTRLAKAAFGVFKRHFVYHHFKKG